MARQKRNDPCACGSGKKFKACHGQTKARPDEVQDSRADKLTFGFAAAAVIALVIWGLVTIFTPTPKAEVPGATSGGAGTAPAGKVWSEEHGHYH